MSFGLAFAQGLVGGFTKNIEREQIARDADDQRLAGLQDMMFQGTIKSAQDGTPMPKQIGDILRKAKEDVSKRPDIGPFGRGKADRLNLDFAELSANLNGVGSNTIDFGSFSIPGTALYGDKTNKRDTYKNAVQFFKSIEGYYKIPEQQQKFLEHFKNNSRDRAILNTMVKSQAKFYHSGFSRIESKINEQDNEIVFTDVLKDNYMDGIEQFVPSLIKDKTKNTVESLASVGDKDSKLNKAIYFKTKKPNVAYKFDLSKMGEGDAYTLSEIAKNNNYSSIQEYIWDYQKLSPHGLLADGDSDPAEAYKYLFHGIELHQLGAGNILKLDSPEKKLALRKYLDDNFADDRYQAVLSLAPIIQEPFRKGSELLRNGVIVPGMKRLAEIESILGYKVDEFNKSNTSANEAVDDLKYLRTLTQKVKTSQGLIKELREIGFSIFGETGQIDQAGKVLVSGGVRDVDNDTAAVFQETIKRYLGSDMSVYGEIEALKISLAAKMARAVDPAGRLSNQDFEMQLKRLGQIGFLTNKIQQDAALSTVITEFEQIVKSQSTMGKIINRAAVGGDVLSTRERRIIYADKAFTTIRKETGGSGRGPAIEAPYLRNITDKNEFGTPLFIPDPNNPDSMINTDTLKSVPKSDIKGA